MSSRTPFHARRRSSRSAFTLIEILVVVVILALLAAIVLPAYSDVTRETRQAAFVKDIKVFNDAAQIFMVREFQFLPDSSSGEVPLGFEPYIDTDAWTTVSPIGGLWDTEYNESGIISALGIHFDGTGDTRDDAYMAEIDAQFDDGDLATGLFRKLGDARYYIVLED